jgi:hypothetical protein
VCLPDRNIAVEVELSPKSPARLNSLLQAWDNPDSISELRIYCEPGTVRSAIERARQCVNASSRIRIFEAPPRKP